MASDPLLAIATDPGDDELTYTLNFGHSSDAVTGETVTACVARPVRRWVASLL